MADSTPALSRGQAARVIIAAAAGSFVNLATVLLYTFGVFVEPVVQNTGWAQTTVGSAAGVAFLVTIVTLPIVGLAVARLPLRRMAGASLLLLAIGALLVGLAPRTADQFAWTLVLAVLIGSGATPTLYSAIVSRAFDKGRGLVLGVVSAFTGVGIAVLPPLAAYIAATANWRTAYVTLGLVALGLAVVVPLVLPKLPQFAPPPAANVGGGGQLPGMTLREALATRVFWVLALMYFLLALVANGVPVQLPVILGERGATPQAAAFGMTVMGLTVIVGRVLVGYLLDRAPPAWVMAIMLGGPLASCALLLWSGGQPLGLLAAAGLGLAVGGEFVGLAWMVSRAFGLRTFGLIYGWLAVTIAAGTSLGPIMIIRLRGLTGDFQTPLLVMLAVAIGAILTALTLRRSQFQYGGGSAVTPPAVAGSPASTTIVNLKE